MLAQFFSKKSVRKFSAQQHAELELENEDGSKSVFGCLVKESARKKLVLSLLAPNRDNRLTPGQKAFLYGRDVAQSIVYWGEVEVQSEDFSDVEVSVPTVIEEEPCKAMIERFECNLGAEYRASKAPSSQKAEVSAVEGSKISLTTNMKLPPKMEIMLTISLPHWGKTVSGTAMTLSSAPIDGSKKNLTEVEWTSIDGDESSSLYECCCYQQARDSRR
jgi:hypothetical protein